HHRSLLRAIVNDRHLDEWQVRHAWISYRLRCRSRECSLSIAFEDCTFEESRISIRPKVQRIGEYEFAEILLCDEPVLHQLISFLQHLIHIDHVKMTDVRAEQRSDACAIRISPRIERPRIDRIVRFAAEIEIAREQFANV